MLVPMDKDVEVYLSRIFRLFWHKCAARITSEFL